MKATWIRPQDIGAYDEYDPIWEAFCEKFGYPTGEETPTAICLAEITVTN